MIDTFSFIFKPTTHVGPPVDLNEANTSSNPRPITEILVEDVIDAPSRFLQEDVPDKLKVINQ